MTAWAKHDFNTIIKVADNTTVVGLITDNDETAYREEVRDLAVWCQDNNLSLNVIKTKEMIETTGKGGHTLILIDRAVVEQVVSFKFLGVHITNELSWSKHTKTVVKRALQHLFPLRRLKRFDMGPQILKTFYSCTIEFILTGCSLRNSCLSSPQLAASLNNTSLNVNSEEVTPGCWPSGQISSV
jgi:hypothetical protein